MVWYLEDTIFGDILKYTLFRIFCARVYGKSPVHSKCWINKRKENIGGFYAGIYDKSVRLFCGVEVGS